MIADKSCFDRDYFECGTGTRKGGYAKPLKERAFGRCLAWIEDTIALRPGDRVLDLGCAYGLFLSLCDRKGLDTYGIDISEHAIEEARGNTKAKLTVADAEQGIPFPDEHFKLVVAFDIIEHLSSPFDFLTDIGRVLEKEGYVVLVTGNSSSIMRFLRHDSWYFYDDPTHKYLFSRVLVRFMLKMVGFKVVRLTTPFHTLPLPISNLLERTGLGGQIFCIAEKP